MNFKLNFYIFLLAFTLLTVTSAQPRCSSDRICYGYGDPHYIRFDDKLFSISEECQFVLLADSSTYAGSYTIMANPTKSLNAPSGSEISIGSILINYKGSDYLIDNSNIVKVNNIQVSLPYNGNNLLISQNGSSILFDALEFSLTFGQSFLKIIDCSSSLNSIVYGLCAGSEADPNSNLINYLAPQSYGSALESGLQCTLFTTTTVSTTVTYPINSLIRTITAHSNEIPAITVLNNSYLASGSLDKTVKIWNTNDGTLVTTLTGHTGWVRTLTTLQNGNLASGGDDARVRIWDTNSFAQLRTLAHTNAIYSLAVLQNGYLACGSYQEIRIWNAYNGSFIRKIVASNVVWSLAVLQSGYLASVTKETFVSIWNADNGSLVKKITDSNGVESFLEFKNGNLATGSMGQVKIWNGTDGSIVRSFTGYSGRVTPLVELPNGYLATGSNDLNLRIWNANNGSLIGYLKGHKQVVQSFAILNNGNLATSSADFTIKIWNV